MFCAPPNCLERHGGGQHVDAELRVIEVATRRIHPLLSTVGLGSDLIWSVGNKLIYTISERPPNQDDSNLWEIEIDPLSLKPTSVPLRLTSDPGFVTTLSITSDGKRLAFFKHSIQPDVYVADLVNAGTGISTPRRLTLDERQDYPFAWSPDNKSVLFDSDRDGTFHIFKQAVERATPELLAGGNEQLVTPRLTPDRGTVLYLVTPKFDQTTNQVRMMRVPLAGGPPQLVLKADGLNNHQCSVLPANVCIFSSIQEGEIRFFRFDPLTGESNELPQLKRRETDYYSFNWSLSPDGTTLATSRKSMRFRKEQASSIGSRRTPTVSLQRMLLRFTSLRSMIMWSKVATLHSLRKNGAAYGAPISFCSRRMTIKTFPRISEWDTGGLKVDLYYRLRRNITRAGWDWSAFAPCLTSPN